MINYCTTNFSYLIEFNKNCLLFLYSFHVEHVLYLCIYFILLKCIKNKTKHICLQIRKSGNYELRH